MQWIAIAFCWIAFILFVLQAKLRKNRRLFTLLFIIAALLAMIFMAIWGAVRNVIG